MTWINYKEIKARVKIEQVLERYGVLDELHEKGDELVGRCKPCQNFLSAGGELTRPCLINISSTSHQGCTARRMRPSMYQSHNTQIRGLTPVQHDRLHAPLTETKL